MPEPLTPKHFDALTRAPYQGHRSKIIWTAEAIGRYIGTSADFVTDTLAHVEGSPIQKVGKRYCAKTSELEAFFSRNRNKPHKPLLNQ